MRYNDKSDLETSGEVVVFENRLVVVSNCFEVANGYQKRSVYPGVADVVDEAGNEGSHVLDVVEVLDEVALTQKVGEVVSDLDGVLGTVVDALLVEAVLDHCQQLGEVVVRYAELLEQQTSPEQLESEVQQSLFLQDVIVGVHIEVPVLESVD